MVEQEPVGAMHLALWYVVIVYHQISMIFIKILLALCMLVGMVV